MCSKDKWGPKDLSKDINKALEVKMIVGRSEFLLQMRDAGREGSTSLFSPLEAPSLHPPTPVPFHQP